MSQPETRIVTAAVILIGDEILSGRTQDTNLKTIADFLNPLGVEVREARVVPDVHDKIVATIREMSAAYNYVFTTGGIGPTHDDITADAVAAAFGKAITVRPDAFAILKPWYDARGQELTEARGRMARIPDDAELILNPVSAAPGFRLGNVFVMAGVPQVMRGMLQDIPHRIEGGAVVHSRTVKTRGVGEGDIAPQLRDLAKARPDVSFGSYPHARLEGSRPVFSVNLVARGRDPAQVEAAERELIEMMRTLNGEILTD